MTAGRVLRRAYAALVAVLCLASVAYALHANHEAARAQSAASTAREWERIARATQAHRAETTASLALLVRRYNSLARKGHDRAAPVARAPRGSAPTRRALEAGRCCADHVRDDAVRRRRRADRLRTGGPRGQCDARGHLRSRDEDELGSHGRSLCPPWHRVRHPRRRRRGRGSDRRGERDRQGPRRSGSRSRRPHALRQRPNRRRRTPCWRRRRRSRSRVSRHGDPPSFRSG